MTDIFSVLGGGMFSMEIILPFFLVLAIVYGALEISKVFTNKGVKAIIAVVFAFFTIMNSQVIAFINSILPYAAMIFVVIFIAWILLKPLRGGSGRKGMDPVLIVVILVLVFVLLARMQATDYLPENSILANSNLLWIVGILVVAVVLWKVYKMGQAPAGG
jgi:glucan phosphoethanolaminetransferase (alkaline phosphatase superfamily)